MSEHSPSRIERDSLGEVAVPADALWQAQTQRAIENFPVSGEPMPGPVVRALARIKAAAAPVNARLGVVEPEVAEAVRAAALEVAGAGLAIGLHLSDRARRTKESGP